jgi:ring-1,2-phenylacetyl-CoA epoxidase subunit PaaD
MVTANIGRGGLTPPAVSHEQIWTALAEVPDPEMPFVNVVELGIVRELEWVGETLRVTITPTFAACPAYEVMSDQIAVRVRQLGIDQVEIRVRHQPTWTSEWITESARAKLMAAGLAPPAHHSGNLIQVLLEPAICPRCSSTNTSLRNSFGTTPCRMIYTCNDCKEPFEQFKPL